MFKLISISGANRGQSYVLSEKTTLGRKEDNNIVLSSSKISKNHCVLEIKNNELIVKDLNSSNGTFVNGFLVQEKKLISGDQILVGNFVFQVVNTQSNKKINHEQVIVKNEKSEIDIMQSSLSLENKQPKNIKDKVIHFLENQFMNFFYNLNKKYEWKSIFISLIFFLILINAVLSVGPLLELNNNFVIQETGRRALFMAKQIANQNTYFISSKNETKTDVSFLENESGVRIAMILDFNNRIIAPANQLNQYFTNGEEAVFLMKVKEDFKNGRETGIWKELDNGNVIAVEPIRVLNSSLGKNTSVAMAIVSVDYSIFSLGLGEIGLVYSRSIVISAIFALLVIFVLYRLTLYPFKKLNNDMDKALKGDIDQVSNDFRFSEMNSLWDIINSAIQRIPKRSISGVSEFSGALSAESQEELMRSFLKPVTMIGNMNLFGIIFFDSNKKILYLNSLFEEITGIRLDGALGEEFETVSRDQSMTELIKDLFEKSYQSLEEVFDNCEFSGAAYKATMSFFSSTDMSIKGYLLIISKLED
jgi:pSer/pThr/pTyr-binding forkhead associated (FHA) protein